MSRLDPGSCDPGRMPDNQADPTMSGEGLTYKAAGVDIDAAERAVELMKAAVDSARRPEEVSALGGFAGLFDISAFTNLTRPLLATSTDGVGTKLAIARALDKHDTVGIDLVAMVVDDLVVCGAEPLFMTDYIACGKLVPERIATIVAGIAAGCRQAGCSLIGGETAEHPGVMDPDEYDLAGAATGIVDEPDVLGRDRVKSGDLLVALGSSGLHSNGFSLVRRVLLEGAGWDLDRHVPELGRTLGEELLEPTLIYTRCCLALIDAVPVHAYVHVTGGGLPGNVERVLPHNLSATVDRRSWKPPAVFGVVGDVGGVSQGELERAFNMGIGMVAVIPPEAADAALHSAATSGFDAWIAGEIGPSDTTSVSLVGDYQA
jgi:phosphoribosylformylglycinamidine cyclo-ligase